MSIAPCSIRKKDFQAVTGYKHLVPTGRTVLNALGYYRSRNSLRRSQHGCRIASPKGQGISVRKDLPMQFSRFVLALVASSVALIAFQKTTLAQTPAPAPRHVHYIEPAQQPKSPTGALAPRLQKLGTHVFPVSTKNA